MIAPGARVRFVCESRLGTLAHPDAAGFEPHVIYPDSRGTYFGPHPTLDGWHLCLGLGVDPDVPQGEAGHLRPLFVPVAEQQFEVLS